MVNFMDYIISDYAYVLECAKKLTKGAVRNNFPEECSFMMIDSKRKVKFDCFSSICHASLEVEESYKFVRNTLDCIVDVIYNKTRQTKQTYISYIKWIMDSPVFKDVYVDEGCTPEEIYDRGFMLAKTDVPSNLLACALISFRMASERPEIIKTWDMLVEHGAQPDLAYLYSHFLTLQNPVKKENPVLKDYTIHSGHIGFDLYNLNLKGIKHYLTNTPQRLNKPYKLNTNYMGVFNLFSSDGEPFYKKCVKDLRAMGGRIKKHTYYFHREMPERKFQVNTYPIKSVVKHINKTYSHIMAEDEK